ARVRDQAHGSVRADISRGTSPAASGPQTRVAKFSPPILTSPSRKASRQLSTHLSVNHPQAVWKTLSPADPGVAKFSPPLLTRYCHKRARGLSTRFSRRFPHPVWKTARRVEHHSNARPVPGLHAPVAVWHDPVEGPRIGVEHQRQEVAVALPHRQ